MSTPASEYIEGQKHVHPELAETYAQLGELYKKKYVHDEERSLRDHRFVTPLCIVPLSYFEGNIGSDREVVN